MDFFKIFFSSLFPFFRNLLHFSKICAIIDLSLINPLEEAMKKLTKTKKIILAVVALILCAATVTGIVLWSSVHPLEKFALKIARKQNFQMDIVLSGIPLFGSVALTCEVDGNVQHIPAATFISEQYIETVGDKRYTYTKDDTEKWIKTESDVDDDDMLSNLQDSEIFKELMNLDNYEEVEGKKNVYRQKEGVEFDGFKDVTITLEKDSCTITMILYTSGMALDTVIVISNIGKTNVTLPSVD